MKAHATLMAFALLISLQANASAESCLEAYDNLDYPNVLSDCAIVATDNDAKIDERVQATLFLGVANAALNKKKAGEEWFMKLLKLDATQRLGDELSPVIRRIFDKAKARFDKEAPLDLIHTPPPANTPYTQALEVRFEIGDKLDLARTLEVTSSALWPDQKEALSETFVLTRTREKGKSIFVGPLKDPAQNAKNIPPQYTLEYTVKVTNAAGKTPTFTTPFVPISLPRTGPEEVESDGATFWILVGTGAAVAIVGAAVAGQALCYQFCPSTGVSSPNAGLEVGVAK